MINNKISDYITFARTFENYKWYKPIIVFILFSIIYLLLVVLVGYLFSRIYGFGFIKAIMRGGYEVLNNPLTIFFTDLCIFFIIPSLYITSKIVKDRPFSSYCSSRGGWNWKLYLKSMIIPLILLIVYEGLTDVIKGSKSASNISIVFILVLFISVPLQSIAEEYLFRGLIMQTLGSWFKIPVLAIVIQAVIFTLGHGYNSFGLIETLTAGIIYGFFTWRTNGLEVSSAIHSANNFTVGLFVMLGLKTSTSNPQLTDVILNIIFLITMAVIMYYVGKKTGWFGEIPENT